MDADLCFGCISRHAVELSDGEIVQVSAHDKDDKAETQTEQ